MFKRRAATLVEMLFTMSLMTVVIGTTVTLYAFVAIRSGDSITQYNTFQQTQDLMQSIHNVASNAISCQNVTLGSVTALKCTMPNNGVDKDGDGIFEQYYPWGVRKTLQEYYLPGKRIWFFPSSRNIAVGTAGTFWYRATRNDDSNIVITNIDSKWSFVTGTTPRIYIPGSVTITQSPATFSTTVQIAIDPNLNPNSSSPGFSGNLGNKLPAITLNRTFYWRHGK